MSSVNFGRTKREAGGWRRGDGDCDGDCDCDETIFIFPLVCLHDWRKRKRLILFNVTELPSSFECIFENDPFSLGILQKWIPGKVTIQVCLARSGKVIKIKTYPFSDQPLTKTTDLCTTS